jgi:hypothetical protein
MTLAVGLIGAGGIAAAYTWIDGVRVSQLADVDGRPLSTRSGAASARRVRRPCGRGHGHLKVAELGG